MERALDSKRCGRTELVGSLEKRPARCHASRESLFNRLCKLVEVKLPSGDIEKGSERSRHPEAVVLLDVAVRQLCPVNNHSAVALAEIPRHG